MRPVVAFVLGCAAGAALGVGAALVFRGDPAGRSRDGDSPVAPAGKPDAATLAVAPPPAPAAAPASPAAAQFVVDLADWRCLVDARTHPDLAKEIWPVLATAYAKAGRTEDLARLLSAALAAGVEPSAIETVVGGWEPRTRLEALRRLRAAHPEAAWSAEALQIARLAGGEGEAAFADVLAAVEAGRIHVLTVVRLLAAADVARTDAALRAMLPSQPTWHS